MTAYDWNNETGPRPDNAQVWTPRAVVVTLWKWMSRCGWAPNPRHYVADLAAGNGRLIEPVARKVPLILNDFDPLLAGELLQQFPPPNVVYCQDFRQLGRELEGVVDTAVGAPPWMESPDNGDYLPQRYVELCERALKPNGLCGLVLPHWFTPETGLRHIVTDNVDPQHLAGWPFPEKPVVHIFRKLDTLPGRVIKPR